MATPFVTLPGISPAQRVDWLADLLLSSEEDLLDKVRC